LHLCYPAISNLHEIEEIWNSLETTPVSQDKHPLAPLFIGRSQNSFRAATFLAFSGFVPETYPLLRQCLETAIYYFEIVKENKEEAWLNRGTTPDATKACRGAFRISDIWKTIQSADQTIHDRCKRLYEVTIDQGAHPNVEGFLTTSEHNDRGVAVDCLLPDTDPWRVVIQYVSKTGIASLRVFHLAYPELFQRDNLIPRLEKLDREFGQVQ